MQWVRVQSLVRELRVAKKLKQRQYHNRFNKDFKMVYITKKSLKMQTLKYKQIREKTVEQCLTIQLAVNSAVTGEEDGHRTGMKQKLWTSSGLKLRRSERISRVLS